MNKETEKNREARGFQKETQAEETNLQLPARGSDKSNALDS